MLISGGEPCIHHEFPNILEAATGLFPRVVVNTNGLFARRLLDAAENSLFSVQVSVDGPQEAHDAIRGEGTFCKTIDGIALLSQKGLDVTVATTVSADNIDAMANLDAALAQCSFCRWTIQREVVYGRAIRDKAVSTNRWNQFVRDVKASYVNRDRIGIRSMYASVDADDSRVPTRTEEEMLWANCGTGRSKLYINPDLTCFPCGCLEQVILGDLSICSVHDIIRALGALPIGQPQGSACATCRFLSICRGGCPGASYNLFNEFGAGDPRCPRVARVAGCERVET